MKIKKRKNYKKFFKRKYNRRTRNNNKEKDDLIKNKQRAFSTVSHKNRKN